jgi:hypothetical protein
MIHSLHVARHAVEFHGIMNVPEHSQLICR